MKVTIETNEEKEQDINFPCLMKSKLHEHYLLAEKNNGGALEGFHLNHKKHSNFWDADCWSVAPKGTKVILEN